MARATHTSLLVLLAALLLVLPAAAHADRSGGSKGAAAGLKAFEGDPGGVLARQLLKSEGSRLSGFDKSLLEADVLLTGKRVTGAVASLSSRSGSAHGLDVLLGVFRALKRNPAMKALKREGLQLKKQPGSLHRYVKEALSPSDRSSLSGQLPGKPRSAEEARLHAAFGRLAALLSSREGKKLARKAAKLSPRSLRSLSPIALASLIPGEELGGAGASAGASSAGQLCGGETSVPTHPELQAALNVEKSFAVDQATDLAEKVLGKLATAASKTEFETIPLPVNQRKATELGLVVGAVGFGAPATAATAAAAAEYEAVVAGKELFNELWDLGTILTPSYLELIPGSVHAAPNEPVAFVACAVDEGGEEAGIVSIGQLTISGHTPGFSSCDASHCSSTEAGTHAVVARTRGGVGYATLTVDPGKLAELKISPDVATVPEGNDQDYEVRGVDDWGNDLGPITDAGSVALSIDPADGGGGDGAFCDARSCGSDGAGAYEVTARYAGAGAGAVRSASARLNVTDRVQLPAGKAFVPYKQQLTSTRAVDPVGWEIVGGSLPPTPTTIYPNFLSSEGVLHFQTEEAGEWKFTARIKEADGSSIEEGYAVKTEPSGCASFPCAIADGHKTFTFVWNANACASCRGTLVLFLDATLAEGAHTSIAGPPETCFGASPLKHCATTFGFEGFQQLIPLSSDVSIYYEAWGEPATEVPIAAFHVVL